MVKIFEKTMQGCFVVLLPTIIYDYHTPNVLIIQFFFLRISTLKSSLEDFFRLTIHKIILPFF